MRIRLLPCGFVRDHVTSTVPIAQPLTTFVVHGAQSKGPLAIDGGSLGLVGEAEDMAQVREVLLTHAHLDHVATLPMWIEALLSKNRAPVAVHASEQTIESLRAHVFNDVIFPNFERLKEDDGRALMEYRAIPENEPFLLAGFAVRAFRTAHPVRTHGYVVDDGESAVVFGADSGPCDDLWEVVRSMENVRAVVLETSFPDFMGAVAKASGHLTPALLREELQKAPEQVKIWITHMKPSYREGIARAIESFRDPRVEVWSPGQEKET